MTKFYTEDYQLVADQLDFKHNLDGEGQHPGYTRWDWRQAVAQQSTVIGYWDWVEYQLEMEQNQLGEDSPYSQGGQDAV